MIKCAYIELYAIMSFYNNIQKNITYGYRG